ncbi:MAG: hypothetical protein AAB481_01585 [Patescibacteria group bacterium]|mgnify:CR=1 FL=1
MIKVPLMSEDEEMTPTSPEMFVNKPELDMAVKSAVGEIQKNEADPVAKAGTAAGELGLLGALGERAKLYMGDQGKVLFKDAKVGGIMFIGLVPLARELGGPARAVRDANKAAYYAGKAGKELATSMSGERSLRALADLNEFSGKEAKMLENAINAIPIGSQAAKRFEKAIAQHYGVREALHFADHGLPPKNLLEKGTNWIKHTARTEIPKLIDPFPDVPDDVKKAADVFNKVSFGSMLVALFPPIAPVAAPIAAVSGIIGLGVPAAWQFMHNRFENINVGIKHGKEVSRLVVDDVSKKLRSINQSDVKQAAQNFV